MWEETGWFHKYVTFLFLPKLMRYLRRQEIFSKELNKKGNKASDIIKTRNNY